jgi:ferrochelatase
MTRRALVLFNLGGPDTLAAVEPFLFNLFSDPAIITLPNPLRWLLARFIARQRAPIARGIYEKLGNGSPLRPNTEAQAAALGARLGEDWQVFVAMRYWHPMSDATATAVAAWRPDEIVLLPLYPQYSSTTTGSSLADWRRAARRAGVTAPTRIICCYPVEGGFVAALADEIDAALAAWPVGVPVRILLSAHGLPKRVVERGDPYQFQIERTAAALRTRLGRPEIETIVCYQSRVGRLEWIGPATDAEIRRAGADKVGLIVAPIAFVSEHSETLVELDVEYRHLADAFGVPRYVRVPTVGTEARFIDGLASLVEQARALPFDRAFPDGGRRICAANATKCACTAPIRAFEGSQ